MKIKNVTPNNHRKAFEVKTWHKTLLYPYAKLEVQPDKSNGIIHVEIDHDLAREAFTYSLNKGEEATIHIDQVLEYNRDPRYLSDLMIYKLTIKAQKEIAASSLSKREIIRRLGTSATQFYRLLDQTNYRKSLSQLLSLFQILDCDVDIIVRGKADRSA